MQHTTEYHEGVFTATMNGSFTFTDNQVFRLILQEIDKQPVTEIVFDLSAVDFVDSAALGMLLLLRDISQKKRAAVILKGASGQVRKMFDVSKFGQLFKVV